MRCLVASYLCTVTYLALGSSALTLEFTKAKPVMKTLYRLSQNHRRASPKNYV